MSSLLRAAAPALVSALVLLPIAACDTSDDLGPSDASAAPVEPAVPAPSVAALSAAERIVFVSYRNGGADIYKVNPFGNQTAAISKSADQDIEPAMSYDNKQVAIVRYRLEGGVGKGDIWLVNTDGTNGHWARDTQSPWDLMDPSWSPDGSHLLVALWFSPNWYLAKMTVATGDVTLIHPIGGGIIGYRPKYDKTGKHIIYVGSSYVTVDQVNADGSGHKALYASTNYAVDHPAFSPDGKRIVFEQGPIPGDMNIFVKNLTSGAVTQLTWNKAEDRYPTWSPDGSRIAFASLRSGTSQIWTMNSTSGGNLTRITHTSSAETMPSWSH